MYEAYDVVDHKNFHVSKLFFSLFNIFALVALTELFHGCRHASYYTSVSSSHQMLCISYTQSSQNAVQSNFTWWYRCRFHFIDAISSMADRSLNFGLVSLRIILTLEWNILSWNKSEHYWKVGNVQEGMSSQMEVTCQGNHKNPIVTTKMIKMT